MKTLGLIGGTTWVSTVDYYRYLNQMTRDRTGGDETARLILYSVNFAELMTFVNAGDWDGVGTFLSAIAVKLEDAGAEGLVLCANTIHIAAEAVQQNVTIPVLHIVDAVAHQIQQQNLKTVGLLGTRFTMEKDFFAKRLSSFGVDTIVPDLAERDFVHESIYNELGKDVFHDSTKQKYLEIINALSDRGAEGIILGCTEIPLLVKPEECGLPAFDTTFIHAKFAVDFAFS